MQEHNTAELVKSMSLDESREEMARQAAAAKRKAIEDGGEEPVDNKRLKASVGEEEGDDEQDGEIDPDDEARYMQALNGQEDCDDAMSENNEMAESKTANQLQLTYGQSSSESAGALKRHAPPTVKGSPRSQRPRTRPGTSVCPAGPSSSAFQLPANAPVFKPGQHKSWVGCRCVASLNLSSEGGGVVLEPPTVASYRKVAANVNKWNVEVAKQKASLTVLENLYVSDPGPSQKVTDQQAKTAVTNLKKVNSKVDKRVCYENVSKGEPLFSTRIGHLREVLQLTKEFRAFALGSVKAGSISQDALKMQIDKILEQIQKLVPDCYLAFPVHWVQAGQLDFQQLPKME